MTQRFIPNKGFQLTENKVSIMSLMEARVKKGEKLSDPFKFAIANLQLDRDWNNEGEPRSPITIEQNPKIFTRADFLTFGERYIYKYVPKQYLDLYKKGVFRLGTIEDYQKIENAKIRDEFEGYSVLKISTGEQEVYSTVIGGYNQYIFCSTHNNYSDVLDPKLQSTFGEILLRIEVEPFAEKIRKRLGAICCNFFEVKYSNAKLFEVDLPKIKLLDGVQFNSSLFEPLKKLSFIPCLYIKPHGFQVENEVRFSFELPYDVKSPKVLEHTGLTKYVKVLE